MLLLTVLLTCLVISICDHTNTISVHTNTYICGNYCIPTRRAVHSNRETNLKGLCSIMWVLVQRCHVRFPLGITAEKSFQSEQNAHGKQVAFQSNTNHPLAESMGYIKFEGMQIFYFDLDMTFTSMCDLDLINDLQPHTED